MSTNGEAQLDAQIHSMIEESKHIVDLHIRCNFATGEVQVSGPMSNPIVFLGMLETAKLQLARLLSRKRESSVIVPTDVKENS